MKRSSQNPFRSISMPSRLYPIKSPYHKEELKKIKSLQIQTLTKTGNPISPQHIQLSIVGLVQLYDSVEEIMKESPSTQLSIQESLDESIVLLDSCHTIQDLFQMIKESLHSLQSALRRKGFDSSIQNDITSYFSSGKKMKKSIAKSLKTLKNFENKINTISNISVDTDSSFMIVVSREMTGFAVSILKSVFIFLMGFVAKSRGWPLVSKVMLAKSDTENNVMNEVGSVDFVLNCIQQKIGNCLYEVSDLQSIQKSLYGFLERIRELEEGMERLFRELVRNRATLLNILTDL